MSLVEYPYLLLAGISWWSVCSAFCAMRQGTPGGGLAILRGTQAVLTRFSYKFGIHLKVITPSPSVYPHRNFQHLLYGFLAIQTAFTLLLVAIDKNGHPVVYAIHLVEIALCGGVFYAVRSGHRARLLLAYMIFTLFYSLWVQLLLVSAVYVPRRPDMQLWGEKLDEKHVWVTAEDATEWEKAGGGDWREFVSKGSSTIDPTLSILLSQSEH